MYPPLIWTKLYYADLSKVEIIELDVCDLTHAHFAMKDSEGILCKYTRNSAHKSTNAESKEYMVNIISETVGFCEEKLAKAKQDFDKHEGRLNKALSL